MSCGLKSCLKEAERFRFSRRKVETETGEEEASFSNGCRVLTRTKLEMNSKKKLILTMLERFLRKKGGQ